LRYLPKPVVHICPLGQPMELPAAAILGMSPELSSVVFYFCNNEVVLQFLMSFETLVLYLCLFHLLCFLVCFCWSFPSHTFPQVFYSLFLTIKNNNKNSFYPFSQSGSICLFCLIFAKRVIKSEF
jgi:hypothetical protein